MYLYYVYSQNIVNSEVLICKYIRRRLFKIYTYIYGQRNDLSPFSHVRPFVYTRASPRVFEISISSILYTLFFLTKKLLIRRNHQWKITIEYSCRSHLRIKIKSLYEKSSFGQDIFTKFAKDYCPRQRHNFCTNYLDQTTLAYSCHPNWPIKHELLCENIFI